MQTRSLPNGGWCWAPRSILFVALLALVSSLVSAATLTPATGGSAISADTTNSTYTSLSGPVIAENATGDIGIGVIVLQAPSGFAFNVNAAVRVRVVRTGGSGPDSRNINHEANNTLLVPNVTAEKITLNITHASKQGVTNKLTWHNISIRPTQGTPLTNSTLVLAAAIANVSNGSAAGTLTTIAGAPAAIIVIPATTTVTQNQSQSYTVALLDISSNSLGDVTTVTNLSAAIGSWLNNTLTIGAAGTWTITAAWNALNATATLTVTDITAPTMTLLGDNPATVEAATAYTDSGATATDDTDGNITEAIVSASNVNTAAPGTYTVNYTSNDSSGNNASATRTVNVVDTTPPVILLLGHNPAEVDEGKSYSEYGYQANDTVDGVLDGAVLVIGSADTARPGTYELLYTVNDSSGNNASTTRTIIVREDTSGNRRGREFSHFSSQAAPAPSSSGAGTSAASSSASGTSAGSGESAPSGETSSETSSGETTAPVAAENAAPRNEMPGTIEDNANAITGAVTGTQRSTTWLWAASAGLLVAGLLAIAGKYRAKKPDFSP
jgi:hypothetical protein